MKERQKRNALNAMAAKVREGKSKLESIMRLNQWPFTDPCFCRCTQHLVVAVRLSRIYQFADEVALGEDDRGAAGLAGSLDTQQFAALPPDEYGTSGT
jgi:hypothetical protein